MRFMAFLFGLFFVTHFCFSATVSVFDVGQGSCSLVAVPNRRLLLIDAGSVKEGASGKTSTINQIAQKTMSQKRVLGYDLDVIITHGDRDHVNWLEKIIGSNKRPGKELKMRIFLGGRKGHYTEKLQKFVDKHGGPGDKYAEDYEKKYALPYFSQGPNLQVQFLHTRSYEDKNDSSIIVKVILGHGRSVLFTGDATKTATDGVTLDPRSKILQLAHHGSSTQGSNEESWVSRIQPVISTISAGTRFGHPMFESIKALLRVGTISPAKEHMLRFSSEDISDSELGDLKRESFEFVKEESIDRKRYYFFKIKRGLFSTIDHGTIICRLNQSTMEWEIA